MGRQSVDCLVIGSNGMLGQAAIAEARARGMEAIGASVADAELLVDLTDPGSVAGLFAAVRPATVLNAAAITSLDECERNPWLAWQVNTRAAAYLAGECAAIGAKLVHVSTDHYFTGDGDRLHVETDPVTLVNEYARTKYGAEGFAVTSPGALVVRTNIAGFRGWVGQPTFAEWLFGAIDSEEPLSLFDDFYTSTIDCAALCRAVFDLVGLGAAGLLNVASCEVASKKRFAEAVARRLGRSVAGAAVRSVRSLPTPRAESVGLDCTRAEALLGRRLPGLESVVDSLAGEYQR